MGFFTRPMTYDFETFYFYTFVGVIGLKVSFGNCNNMEGAGAYMIFEFIELVFGK